MKMKNKHFSNPEKFCLPESQYFAACIYRMNASLFEQLIELKKNVFYRLTIFR